MKDDYIGNVIVVRFLDLAKWMGWLSSYKGLAL